MTSLTSPNHKYHIEEDRYSIQHMKRKGITAMPRPHSHDLAELYYLIQGERVYFVDDRVITVHKGELILISGRELHSTASSEVAEFERILINYDPALLPPSLQNEAIWFHDRGYRLFADPARAGRSGNSNEPDAGRMPLQRSVLRNHRNRFILRADDSPPAFREYLTSWRDETSAPSSSNGCSHLYP